MSFRAMFVYEISKILIIPLGQYNNISIFIIANTVKNNYGLHVKF